MFNEYGVSVLQDEKFVEICSSGMRMCLTLLSHMLKMVRIIKTKLNALFSTEGRLQPRGTSDLCLLDFLCPERGGQEVDSDAGPAQGPPLTHADIFLGGRANAQVSVKRGFGGLDPMPGASLSFLPAFLGDDSSPRRCWVPASARSKATWAPRAGWVLRTRASWELA